ncbi:SixA phosphatase family protein [Wenzhouxiangella marina]|uniref:SixA phosphatase family protein n=1 Tax=Wenzhouxiangella marina TaxID=1579979 RepID=UPI000673A067|nr:histidine phosphatase family protein [Wenzhouxiangella marina]MBB6087483.1 phosphohistidine phosphatase [Wenzhouxiangella marina]
MRLWILRHARAEDHSPTGRDQDRALSARGQLACRHLNRWLRETDLELPARVRVSPSRRTRQTAELALADLPVGRLIDESLWLAPCSDLLDQIRTARPDGELWLIGHNPGLEELIARLGAELPVPGLKPGTLVVLDLPEKGPASILQIVPPSESV